MGKTVPSYRMAVEWEIDKWKALEMLCQAKKNEKPLTS